MLKALQFDSIDYKYIFGDRESSDQKGVAIVIPILRLGYSLCPMSCEFMVVIGWIIHCILLGA